VRDIKLGRQASVIHLTLSQGEGPQSREEVVGYITNSNMHTEEGITFSTNYKLTPAAPPVDLTLLKQDKDASWCRQEEFLFPGFRKAEQQARFYFPRGGQKQLNLADEWIQLRSGERWTNSSLGYVADMWPIPAEAFVVQASADDAAKQGSPSKVRRFWYPTILLNLDIKKALPEEGVEWLFSRVVSKQIKNGRMDLEVVIMDEAGELVALSSHVALAVPSERNLAGRKKGSRI
jgi:hypothetical protein